MSQSIRTKGVLIDCVGESNTLAMELVLLLSTCDSSVFLGWVVRVNETYLGNVLIKNFGAAKECAT